MLGNTFKDCVFEGPSDSFVLVNELELNEMVFCASAGPYSDELHKHLLEGAAVKDEGFYEGNAELTHYAVLDRLAFCQAAFEAMKKHDRFKSDETENQMRMELPVLCGNPARQHSFAEMESYAVPTETSEENHLRTIFVKPVLFSSEREYRMIIRINAPSTIPTDAEPIDLQSEELLGSILKIGFI